MNLKIAAFTFATICVVTSARGATYVTPVATAKVKERVFSTTTAFRNGSGRDITCHASYAGPKNTKGALQTSYSIPAGRTVIEEDTLMAAGAIGVMRLDCSGELLIAARVQTSTNGGRTFDIGHVFRAANVTPSTRSGRSHSLTTTSDVLVMETSGTAASIDLVVRGLSGKIIGERTYQLPAFALQVIDLSTILKNDETVQLAVAVKGSAGRIVVMTPDADPSLHAIAQRMTSSAREQFNVARARQTTTGSGQTGTTEPPAAAQLVAAAFKAAPFRDSFTGLVYMRDRWYDPRSGTFMTPDRLRFTDSPNPYAFAGGDPVNKSDPTGMYQADFHFGVTAFLAQEACLKRETAFQVARYTEAPDQDAARSPIANGVMGAAGLDRKKEVLREWHFPKAELTTGEVVPGSPEARKRVAAGLQSGDVRTFGEGLHPFQDSWSHRGKPSLRGFAGHPVARGGVMSTATDVPWRYPAEALTAAEETFKYLKAFAAANPGFRRAGAQPCRAWASIANDVRAYIGLRERGDKRRWLAARGIVMPEAYWDDVDMGPIEQEEFDRKRMQELDRQANTGPKF